MQINIETLTEVLELMKKFGVIELRDAQEFVLIMPLEEKNKTADKVDISTQSALIDSMAKIEAEDKATDEEILMDPYHGLHGDEEESEGKTEPKK